MKHQAYPWLRLSATVTMPVSSIGYGDVTIAVADTGFVAVADTLAGFCS